VIRFAISFQKLCQRLYNTDYLIYRYIINYKYSK